MSGSAFIVRLLGAASMLVVLAACGSTSSSVSSSKSSAPGSGMSGTAPGGAVAVAKTSLGPVLVDGKGMTVYLLTADTKGHSTCSDQCLQYWPLVPAPAGTSLPPVQGVTAALATTKATSGASMVTAGGWPLYTFVKDRAPGDVTGEGVKTFGGTWYAVSPSGAPVTAPATSAPSPTSSGGSAGGGGGYGY